ncbi:MAG: hypothetical protein JSU08_15670 [Acidobacteria bacterium]|nr:hypothetical protein [Acidobacteriota bacterium]
MNVRRILWFGVWVLSLATWFASASTSGVRPPAVPLPPARVSPLDMSMASLQSEVGRLHERLAPTIAPTRSRDLFRFQERTRRPVSRSLATRPVAEAAATTQAPAPPPPSLSLIGVAEDVTPDGVVRTAIVSGLGDVFLVKVGDTIRDRYRVGPVSGDATQIIDLTTGTSTTIALH